MKKKFWMLGLMILSLSLFTSCSLLDDLLDDDDDEDVETVMEGNYFKVENAVFTEGRIPSATTNVTLNVKIDETTTSKGGTNVIRIARDREYRRFFIGAKGVDGYWIYTPTTRASVKTQTRADDEDDEDWYEIPMDNGDGDVNSYTLVVSAEEQDGNITQQFEQEINYTDAISSGQVTRITSNMKGDYFKLSYDSQGRIVSLYNTIDECRLKINYSTKTIIEEDVEDGVAEVVSEYVFSLNSRGYISELTDSEDGERYTMSYNNNGNLQSFFGGNLSWSNGNLISSSATSGGDRASVTTEYSVYPNIENQFSYAMWRTTFEADFYMTGLMGKRSKNLPKSVITKWNDSVWKTTFEYTFREDGTIATEICKHTYGDGDDGYTFTEVLRHVY